MNLTDKSLEQFDKWYIKTECQDIPPQLYKTELGLFYNTLTDSMKYGVLVDFFDSVRIEIRLKHIINLSRWMYVLEDENGVHLNDYMKNSKCNSRLEARAKAIEKANEIYNNR